MSTPTQISPRVWVSEVSLEGFSVRSIAILGDRKAVVWDTLSHPTDMAGIAALVEGMPAAIVYSHADWDHIGGTAALPYRHCRIIGHEHCRRRFADEVPLTLSRMQAGEPGRWDAVELVAPNVSFADTFRVDLGGITLDLHRLPGHTADSIVGFVEQLGVLLVGDAVEVPLPDAGTGQDIEVWLNRLHDWSKDSRVRLVIPAHGPVGGTDLLLQTIDYLSRLSAGMPIVLPDTTNDFYRSTHQNNLRAYRHPQAVG